MRFSCRECRGRLNVAVAKPHARKSLPWPSDPFQVGLPCARTVSATRHKPSPVPSSVSRENGFRAPVPGPPGRCPRPRRRLPQKPGTRRIATLRPGLWNASRHQSNWPLPTPKAHGPLPLEDLPGRLWTRQPVLAVGLSRSTTTVWLRPMKTGALHFREPLQPGGNQHVVHPALQVFQATWMLQRTEASSSADSLTHATCPNPVAPQPRAFSTRG